MLQPRHRVPSSLKMLSILTGPAKVLCGIGRWVRSLQRTTSHRISSLYELLRQLCVKIWPKVVKKASMTSMTQKKRIELVCHSVESFIEAYVRLARRHGIFASFVTNCRLSCSLPTRPRAAFRNPPRPAFSHAASSASLQVAEDSGGREGSNTGAGMTLPFFSPPPSLPLQFLYRAEWLGREDFRKKPPGMKS